MKYLNFDLDLIVTNEYGKKIYNTPITLQFSFYNVRNTKLIQYLNFKNLAHYKFDPLAIPTLGWYC